jgi:Retrotransposon gag protein
MSQARRCAYFGLLMRGPAEVWWNTLMGSVKHDYDDLRKRFLGNFANEDFHKLRAATVMHTRKQGQNETATDYYTAIIKLTKELPAVTEEILYYLILNGL